MKWTLVFFLFSELGCAHISGQTVNREALRPAVVSPNDDPLNNLEQQLAKSHSDRITLPTSLLRKLLRSERIQQNQCKVVTGQLEAIKNVDLQEAEGRQP
jgi:hypothetical protein